MAIVVSDIAHTIDGRFAGTVTVIAGSNALLEMINEVGNSKKVVVALSDLQAAPAELATQVAALAVQDPEPDPPVEG